MISSSRMPRRSVTMHTRSYLEAGVVVSQPEESERLSRRRARWRTCACCLDPLGALDHVVDLGDRQRLLCPPRFT